mmetsp:Transcript_25982/g.75045  ORF Transcript_25982/g.75045 Transcript_25982/m.75045 type:complete len:89 (+) Transcript_25982:89-355(+)
MLTEIFALLIGVGVGAYNHEHLDPCLRDTVTVGKQKAAPYAKQFSEKAKETVANAAPVARQVNANIRERGLPYLRAAQDRLGGMAATR